MCVAHTRGQTLKRLGPGHKFTSPSSFHELPSPQGEGGLHQNRECGVVTDSGSRFTRPEIQFVFGLEFPDAVGDPESRYSCSTRKMTITTPCGRNRLRRLAGGRNSLNNFLARRF